MRRVIVWAILPALCLGGWLGWLTLQERLLQPLNLPDASVTLDVPAGSGLKRILTQMDEAGWIAHPRYFRWYARWHGYDSRVQAGEYQLTSSMNMVNVLDLITSGQVIQYALTLVDGLTYREYRNQMASENNLKPVLSGMSDEAIRDALGIGTHSIEGWVFPDTYFFTKGTSDLDILKRATKKMQAVLEQEWMQRASNLPYRTAYEALIMASIVEKETGVSYERPAIAGVMVRRLQKGMRLQTDPTVIYGLGDAYQGRIGRAQLRQRTPYNTYLISGLPPTPIANPGRAAIHAALHPDKGTALYFVAKGDGSHHFSDSLEDHNRAVRRFQMNRSADYRSSPTQP